MRGAVGGARGVSAVPRHLPPRPPEPVGEPVREHPVATEGRIGRGSVPSRPLRRRQGQLPHAKLAARSR
jgi:hypothetical protein